MESPEWRRTAVEEVLASIGLDVAFNARAEEYLCTLPTADLAEIAANTREAVNLARRYGLRLGHPDVTKDKITARTGLREGSSYAALMELRGRLENRL